MPVPIIMESELERVKEKLLILKKRGEKRVQIDIGDGLFSEMWSVAPADLHDLHGIEVELHLLVDDPIEWVPECVALNPKKIVAQIERMGSQGAFIDEVESYQKQIEAGLALSLTTPIEAIDNEILGRVKTILLMAVPVGTSGSKFDQRVLDKIARLRKIYTGKIVVDGGINPETERKCLESGADETLANSAYWRGEFLVGESRALA